MFSGKLIDIVYSLIGDELCVYRVLLAVLTFFSGHTLIPSGVMHGLNGMLPVFRFLRLFRYAVRCPVRLAAGFDPHGMHLSVADYQR